MTEPERDTADNRAAAKAEAAGTATATAAGAEGLGAAGVCVIVTGPVNPDVVFEMKSSR